MTRVLQPQVTRCLLRLILSALQTATKAAKPHADLLVCCCFSKNSCLDRAILLLGAVDISSSAMEMEATLGSIHDSKLYSVLWKGKWELCQG